MGYNLPSGSSPEEYKGEISKGGCSRYNTLCSSISLRKGVLIYISKKIKLAQHQVIFDMRDNG